jgi:signal transduction histidine kinase
LDRAAFALALAQFPELAPRLMQELSGRLRSTTVLTAVGAALRGSTLDERQPSSRDTPAAAGGEAALQRAVLDGVQLAVRTVEHHLNNQLAVVRGYSELLAADPRLPEELREWARRAVEGAQKAAGTVQKLRTLDQVRKDTSLGDGPLLDLERAGD